MTPFLLHQAIERAAARYPERTALRVEATVGSGEQHWSYGELERASRRVALELRALGMPPGARIGVWMRKSPEAVAALLATLRAGGVYVPLDAGAPTGRVAALAADCGLWGLFADPDLAALAAGWARPPRRLAAADDRLAAEPAALPPAATTSDDLAYILYTSGSTGAPKGVMLTHAHALNFIRWAAAEVGLRSSDRVASHAPFHFDLSIFDLWATLSRGGEVCLLDAVTARFPRAVADWIGAHRITVWYSVPSALVQLLPHAAALEAGGEGQIRLRCVIFAGEVFPAASLRAWRQKLPQATFHNWYGPTETNVCTAYRLPPMGSGAATPDPLPIGRACPNFELALLDEQQQPVEAGEPGYLWVRGPGILAGYWGDAARSAQVTRTAARMGGGSADTGQRWYNTGDLARWGGDGELYFQGRRDDLIKCRGYRVSLLEVAQALETCAGVRQAAVVAVSEDGQAARERATGLVAYVSGEGAAKLDPTELRRGLVERLPPYMIPERIEVRAVLPVTSTGKIDRQRLHPSRPAAAPA